MNRQACPASRHAQLAIFPARAPMPSGDPVEERLSLGPVQRGTGGERGLRFGVDVVRPGRPSGSRCRRRARSANCCRAHRAGVARPAGARREWRLRADGGRGGRLPSPAQPHRVLHRVQANGLGTRQSDTGDRRSSVVPITDAGRGVILAHVAASNAIVERLSDRDGAEELEALLDIWRSSAARRSERSRSRQLLSKRYL